MQGCPLVVEANNAAEEWTFPHRRPFSTTLATKARSGGVILDMTLEGIRIDSVDIEELRSEIDAELAHGPSGWEE